MTPVPTMPASMLHITPVAVFDAAVIVLLAGGGGFVLYGLAQLERMARASKAQDRGQYVAYVESDQPSMDRRSW